MSKPILFAMLAVAGSLIAVSDVEARCCRRNCCQRSCCQQSPACGCGAVSGCSAATGCSAAQGNMGIAPTVANAPNSGSTYQSYSFEPNAAQAAPVQVAPVQYNVITVRPAWSEYDYVLRGNRKVVNTPY